MIHILVSLLFCMQTVAVLALLTEMLRRDFAKIVKALLGRDEHEIRASGVTYVTFEHPAPHYRRIVRSMKRYAGPSRLDLGITPPC
jgi:hypothetical protein